MIVEINKVVEFTDTFEVKPSEDGQGFLICMEKHDEFHSMYVTREELELISKAITEELKKAEG